MVDSQSFGQEQCIHRHFVETELERRTEQMLLQYLPMWLPEQVTWVKRNKIMSSAFSS